MPGVALNLDLPVVGTDTWAIWADKVVTALTAIQDDLEPQVTTSEINENQDHAFNGYAITDARWIAFRAGNILSVPTNGFGFKNGDAWIGDGNGNQIQVTSGGALLAGGNGFVGPDTAYAYYTAASNLYEFKDVSDNFDSVKAASFVTEDGGALDGGASGVTVSLPTTNPAGPALLSMSSAGQLSHTAAVTVDCTFNNANLVFTGTGKLEFPTRRRNVSFIETPSSLPSLDITVGTKHVFPIPQADGERVVDAVFRFNLSASTQLRLRIERGVDGALVAQMLATASTFLDVVAGGVQTQTLTLNTPYTFAAVEALYLTIEGVAGGTAILYDLKAGVDSV